MVYQGIGSEMLEVDWYSNPFTATLAIPKGSKLIGLSLDKIKENRDSANEQAVWVTYLRGDSNETGIGIMLVNESTWDSIDDANWEYICSGHRKCQIVHLFREKANVS